MGFSEKKWKISKNREMKELALHILDIAQNSIRAKAALIEINITEKPSENEYLIDILDDGAGMDEPVRKQIEDPFYTSRKSRKVGLGIPLFKQNAELSGGSIYIISEKEKGTHISAIFGFNHIDRPILGDIAGTLLILIANENQTDIRYKHQTDEGVYVFDSREVKKILGEMPISSPTIRKYLLEMIHENLEQIQISE